MCLCVCVDVCLHVYVTVSIWGWVFVLLCNLFCCFSCCLSPFFSFAFAPVLYLCLSCVKICLDSTWIPLATHFHSLAHPLCLVFFLSLHSFLLYSLFRSGEREREREMEREGRKRRPQEIKLKISRYTQQLTTQLTSESGSKTRRWVRRKTKQLFPKFSLFLSFSLPFWPLLLLFLTRDAKDEGKETGLLRSLLYAHFNPLQLYVNRLRLVSSWYNLPLILLSSPQHWFSWLKFEWMSERG